MTGMDAATYNAIARQLGACDEEAAHALDNARYDLAHRPERVRGDDPYAIAAQALTAFHAQPVRPQAEVTFAHHVWAPGHVAPAHWGRTPADEFMAWFERARTAAR